MMRFLGLIPARGGSKGIPGKNLVDLAGKPLISYTIAASLASKRLDRVILSTDDQEIADLGQALEVQAPFLRPAHLADDQSSMLVVVEHALDWLKVNENYRPDAIVILQPTTPLRTSTHIDEAIIQFEQEDVDSLVSVSEPQEHPLEMVSFEGQEMQFAVERGNVSTRQEYPTYYFLNGAITITRVDLLLEQQTFWGGRVAHYLMDTLASIDIDTRADLAIADGLMRRVSLPEAKSENRQT
jgi:CMP-N,N'-diacetyllegionaminic acid synthase